MSRPKWQYTAVRVWEVVQVIGAVIAIICMGAFAVIISPALLINWLNELADDVRRDREFEARRERILRDAQNET